MGFSIRGLECWHTFALNVATPLLGHVADAASVAAGVATTGVADTIEAGDIRAAKRRFERLSILPSL